MADSTSYSDFIRGIDKLNQDQKEVLYERLKSELEKNKPSVEVISPTVSVTSTQKIIRRSISNETKPHSSIDCCLHCGSTNIKKIGKTKGGMQRFLCKDCHKSFSENYGLITHYTHLAEWQWKEVVRATINGDSLTKLSKNISVSVKTSWLCRMKIYQTIKNIYGYCDSFNNIVEVDGKYERISFKGLKNKNFFIDKLGRMPRHHRSRKQRLDYLNDNYNKLFVHKPHLLKEMIYGNQRRLLGRETIDINHQHVCILTAVDRSNNIYIEPVTSGSAKSMDIYKHLYDKLSVDAVLITDEHNGYKFLSKNVGLKHVVIESGLHVKDGFSLSRVNSLHSSMDRFFVSREFYPATKYLDLYLMMFWWLEKNKDVTSNELYESLYLILSGNVSNEVRASMKKVVQSELIARPLPIDCKGLY